MDLRQVWQVLQECGVVGEDWNGQPMEPPSPACIETVHQILLRLDELPSLYVTGRSSIQLEYHKVSSADYIECEVFSDYIYVLQVDSADWASSLEDVSHFWKFSCFEIEKVCELLNKFSARLDQSV